RHRTNKGTAPQSLRRRRRKSAHEGLLFAADLRQSFRRQLVEAGRHVKRFLVIGLRLDPQRHVLLMVRAAAGRDFEKKLVERWLGVDVDTDKGGKIVFLAGIKINLFLAP